MENEYIKEQWEDFREKCISKEIPQEQVDTSRSIFFAGAIAMFKMVAMEMGEEGVSQEEAHKKLDALYDEIDYFRLEVGERARYIRMSRRAKQA